MLRYLHPDTDPDAAPEKPVIADPTLTDSLDPEVVLIAEREIPAGDTNGAAEEDVVSGNAVRDKQPVAGEKEQAIPEAGTASTAELPEETEEELHPEEHDDLQPPVAFNELSRAELLKILREIVADGDTDQHKHRFFAIRDAYTKIKEEETAAKRLKYIENGGEPEDFEVQRDETDTRFEAGVKEFQAKRAEQRRRKEQELQDNLKKKQDILNELKHLLDQTENISASFDRLHELQAQWRAIGQVPVLYVDELWKNYYHHVNNFYDVIKINKELRELDQKKNLELKTGLCEKAEELLLEPSIRKSLEEYKLLQEQWKQIGNASREQNETIWERFRSAGDKLFERRREYIQQQENDFADNLAKKNAVIERTEQFVAGLPFKTHQLWQQASDQMAGLLDEWKATGFASRKHNEAAWQRFRQLRDRFYDAKEEFYKTLRATQNHNYKLKVDICMEMEALKDSSEWKKTGERIRQLQEQWKNTGPVAKKHTEKLWERLKKACDGFYQNRDRHFSGLNEEQELNLKKKQELIGRVNAFEHGENGQENFEALKAFQAEWMEIGHVPIKEKDRVSRDYRSAIDKQFNKLKAEGAEARRQLFRAQVENARQSGAKDKLYHQRHAVEDKLRKLQSEIQTWENNIGFLGASKGAQELKKETERKIAKAREELELLSDQLKILREE